MLEEIKMQELISNRSAFYNLYKIEEMTETAQATLYEGNETWRRHHALLLRLRLVYKITYND